MTKKNKRWIDISEKLAIKALLEILEALGKQDQFKNKFCFMLIGIRNKYMDKFCNCTEHELLLSLNVYISVVI